MSVSCFNKLTRERADKATDVGVPVEVRSADELGGKPKGKSRQADVIELNNAILIHTNPSAFGWYSF
jgi:hypothetical protein